MPKLFYTDPLVAAYMAREFGVKVLVENPAWGVGGHIWSDSPNDIYNGWIEFDGEEGNIHPDSHHIFEPQKVDMVLWANGISTSSGAGDGSDSLKRVLSHPLSKIILRDGKQFFMPEQTYET